MRAPTFALSVVIVLTAGFGLMIARDSSADTITPQGQPIGPDGIDDVFFYNGDDTSVIYFGDGDGSFTEGPAVTNWVNGLTAYPGFFNNDTISDLLFYNFGTREFAVLFSDGEGGLTQAPTYDQFQFPVELEVGQFNGDGLTDVVVYDPAEERSGGVTAYYADGSGDWIPGETFDTEETGLSRILPGDYNSDNLTDVFLSDFFGNNLTLYANSNGTWTQDANTLDFPYFFQQGWAADFNGDDRDDLLAEYNVARSVQVFFKNSSQGWSAGEGDFTYQFSDYPGYVPGDWTGDGRADVFAHDTLSQQQPYTGQTFFVDNDGNFSEGPEIADFGEIEFTMVPGNFTHDDLVDLLYYQPDNGGGGVLASLGGGSFDGGTFTPFSGDWEQIVVADFGTSPNAVGTPTAGPTSSPSPTPSPTPGGQTSTTTPVGQTPTPTAVGPTPTPTPTPVGQTPSPTPFGLTPTPTGSAGDPVQGDVNCNGVADTVDALGTLRHTAGLPVNQDEPCPDIGSSGTAWGDVDCDGDVDSVDALKILRHVAALPVSQSEPCADIGAAART